MSGNLAPRLKFREFDNNGDPLAGGKLYTYEAGTTTPRATYTDSTLATPNANPVILDANGKANVWLNPELAYKFNLTDADDVQQDGWPVDNVVGLLNESAALTAGLTELTAAASGDLFRINDISAGVDKQITLLNALKGLTALSASELSSVLVAIANLTEDTDPSNLDSLLSYDQSASGVKRVYTPRLFSGFKQPGQANLGLAQATTTSANDSVKIQGATAALSASNPLAVTLLSGITSGLLTTLYATADVTIDLTGAHWGLGTLGDFSSVDLRVYAINDSGTLKWGVSLRGGLRLVTSLTSSATATDITAKNDMLVSSTLTGTHTCVEVGHVSASFDDTGGDAEDLWSVAAATFPGIPVRDQTDFGDVPWTPTGSWTANSPVYTGKYRRVGNCLELVAQVTLGGAPDNVALTINLPSGLEIDTDALPTTLDGSTALPGTVSMFDSAIENYIAVVRYSSATAIEVRADDGDGTVSALSQTNPITWATGDIITVHVTDLPIVQWSSN